MASGGRSMLRPTLLRRRRALAHGRARAGVSTHHHPPAGMPTTLSLYRPAPALSDCTPFSGWACGCACGCSAGCCCCCINGMGGGCCANAPLGMGCCGPPPGPWPRNAPPSNDVGALSPSASRSTPATRACDLAESAFGLLGSAAGAAGAVEGSSCSQAGPRIIGGAVTGSGSDMAEVGAHPTSTCCYPNKLLSHAEKGVELAKSMQTVRVAGRRTQRLQKDWMRRVPRAVVCVSRRVPKRDWDGMMCGAVGVWSPAAGSGCALNVAVWVGRGVGSAVRYAGT
jgi:hypothetical protein